MADLRGVEPRPGLDEPSWQVYDGRRESVSDGVPCAPAPAPRMPRWPWAVAGVAAAAAVGVVAVAVVTSTGPASRPGSNAVVAPATWQRVDASLSAGAILVSGGAEADGIVLTATGLVATSYSRIMGDQRPPDEFGLNIDGLPATIVAADEASDIALVRAPGFVPESVAKPGTPVRVGERLTLLDNQGGGLPIVGIGVTVTATDGVCSRAGSTARPAGLQFSLDVATAEPGAALVRSDGTAVGMYYGGNDSSHHCAIPIAAVLEVARTHNAGD